MPIVRLDHVQVAAPRTRDAEEQARAFYGGLLGLKEIEKPYSLKRQGGVWFSLGGGQLHVGIEDDFRPARKAHPALVVQGLADLRSRLEGQGVETAEAEPIPGIKRFYAHDPFGNRIELMAPVTSGEEGRDDKQQGARVGWQILGTTYPFQSPWFDLRKDRVRVEGRGEIEYAYIEAHGATGVVPVTSDGKMVLIRQYRYAVDQWLYEIPAGGMHDAEGEPPDVVARKELGQEVGGTCRDLTYMGYFYPSVGNSSAAFHVFLAWGVALTEEPEREDTERIEVHVVPVREAVHMARMGEMKDGVSALSILMCEEALREWGYL